MILDWLPTPAIIGHRGASAHAPENTLEAFDLAVKMGADAIEFDVLLTRDEQVAVIHDPQLDRTTSGTGRVSALSAAEVQRLSAAGKFQEAYPEARVPLLQQVLDRHGRQIPLIIELKNLHAPNDRLPERVAQLVQAASEDVRILFSSFNPLALWRIARLCPDRPAAILVAPGWVGLWSLSVLAKLIRHQAVHPYFEDVTQRLVSRIHHQGRRVHTYTVNRGLEAQKLVALGVDGLFTDDPGRIRAILSGGEDSDG